MCVCVCVCVCVCAGVNAYTCVCARMYECELVDDRNTVDKHNCNTHRVPHQHGDIQPLTYQARGREAHIRIQVSALHQIYKKL